MLQLTDCVVGNEHEIECLLRHHDLQQMLVIRTHGAEPIAVDHANGTNTLIEVPPVAANVDPTGCGDAFISGLCHHLVQHATAHNMPIEEAIAKDLRSAILTGCALAAACLACSGPQQHQLPQHHPS
jgi:sugar/nucleoside kinase (ribokinase family)